MPSSKASSATAKLGRTFIGMVRTQVRLEGYQGDTIAAGSGEMSKVHRPLEKAQDTDTGWAHSYVLMVTVH